jgi:hypothetical protein
MSEIRHQKHPFNVTVLYGLLPSCKHVVEQIGNRSDRKPIFGLYWGATPDHDGAVARGYLVRYCGLEGQTVTQALPRWSYLLSIRRWIACSGRETG